MNHLTEQKRDEIYGPVKLWNSSILYYITHYSHWYGSKNCGKQCKRNKKYCAVGNIRMKMNLHSSRKREGKLNWNYPG